MKSIRFIFIVYFFVTSIGCMKKQRNVEEKENLFATKNCLQDSVYFPYNSEKHTNAVFWGINHYDTLNSDLVNGKYKNTSCFLVDTIISSKIAAMRTNTQNYLMSQVLNDTTKLTNYDYIEINNSYDKYYFCGNLLLSQNFNSFIFLNQKEFRQNDTVYLGNQSIWLFNVKNNIIVSVAELYHKGQGIETTFYMESYREGNVFVNFSDINREKIRKRFFGNKNIEETKKKLKNTDCILYKINDDGYIEIIERN
ncbi:hypothetical protein FACS189429_3570 [Bacteroidia bacterium]|nr:hypothetical protein FACS189429_3570 [Bacteroidia bacterium]